MRSKDSGIHLGLQFPTWEFTWECEGSFPHTLCTPKSMWSDSRLSLLACNLATPCLDREPKARFATVPFCLLLGESSFFLRAFNLKKFPKGYFLKNHFIPWRTNFFEKKIKPWILWLKKEILTNRWGCQNWHNVPILHLVLCQCLSWCVGYICQD